MNGLRDSPSWTQLDAALALLNRDTTEQVSEQTWVTVAIVQGCGLHKKVQRLNYGSAAFWLAIR